MERVSLKNIKFSEWNSEETNCFQADVYFDNKKVGYCKNDGRGGSTYCSAYEGKSEIFNEMSLYCLNLPPITMYGTEFKSDLETVVDLLFEKWLDAKFEKEIDMKRKKDFSKGLCFAKNKTDRSYQIMTFKKGNVALTIDDLVKDFSGRNYLRTVCAKKKEEGFVILNDNIPEKCL